MGWSHHDINFRLIQPLNATKHMKSKSMKLMNRKQCNINIKSYLHFKVSTRWFKYDWDCLCVNLATSVPVICEPPCNWFKDCIAKSLMSLSLYYSGQDPSHDATYTVHKTKNKTITTSRNLQSQICTIH